MNSTNQASILNIYEIAQSGPHYSIPCNLYKNNLQKRVYVDSRDVTDKDQIYPNRIYMASQENKNIIKEGSYYSVKEVQRHPVSNRILHIDLFLIEPGDEKITLDIPLKYIGASESVDIKRGSYPIFCMRSVKVITSHKYMVPYIEIDVSSVKPESSLRGRDIKAPNGIHIKRPEVNILTLAPARAE